MPAPPHARPVSGDISFIIIKCQRDDQLLIYCAHIETNFTKENTSQREKIKDHWQASNVYKKNGKVHHTFITLI